MSDKKRMGCMIFLLVIILIVIFGGGGLFVYKQYNKTLAKIKEELSQIPEFDEIAVKEKIAKDLNVKLPVDKPYMQKVEVDRAIKKELRKKALKIYTTSSLAAQVKKIKDKYDNLPSIGSNIEIKLKKGDELVKGTYKGIIDEDGVEYLNLNGKKIKLFDVNPDYYWMFNDLSALDRLSDEVKQVRADFAQKRAKLISNSKKQMTMQLYTANGYMFVDEKWKPVYDIFRKRFLKAKEDFAEARRVEITKTFERNKLFGIIQIEAVQEGINSIDLKELKNLKDELSFGEDKTETPKKTKESQEEEKK